MVILITGATHTGKTVLAEKLVRKTGSFCLSLDHLKMGLIRSGNTALTVYDDEKLTDYLWPIAKEMIKTAIENCQDLIVEGCYIPFDWRKDFEDIYLSQIKYVCISMSADYIRSNFDKILSHSTDAEQRLEPDISIETLIRDNQAFTEGCLAVGNDIVIIDHDWEDSVTIWLSSINNQNDRSDLSC